MKQTGNQLFTRTLTMTLEQAQNTPVTILSEWLSNDTFLYSYYVKCKVKDNAIEKYSVNINVSQTERYNTIPVPEAILGIVDSLNSKSMSLVIGYQQPPLEVIIEAFTPLVQSMARKMANRWSLEYEDMVQTCYVCMCTLYNKGYYLHKSLLRTTFVREVLASLRKMHTAMKNGYKETISLNQVISGTDQLTYEAVIKDERQERLIESLEDNDEKEYKIKIQRDKVISVMGERQYNSLLASVETGTLTQTERSLMYRVGKKVRNKH